MHIPAYHDLTADREMNKVHLQMQSHRDVQSLRGIIQIPASASRSSDVTPTRVTLSLIMFADLSSLSRSHHPSTKTFARVRCPINAANDTRDKHLWVSIARLVLCPRSAKDSSGEMRERIDSTKNPTRAMTHRECCTSNAIRR